nr:aspartate kinase [Segetibacter sp.]
MQVLKFGGSSVANSANINKVVAIVHNALQKDETIVVVSALGGVTDALLQVANLAANGIESFKENLRALEYRHLETVKDLIPFAQQSSVLSMVKKSCNDLEDICNGVFLLRELSARTKDRICSYGELLSSQIVAARFTALNAECVWKDAREIITTDSHYGYAGVDFAATYSKAKEYFFDANQSLFIVPGFIASDSNGNTTTLGRGGSDYTAAILAAAVDAVLIEIWTDVSGMMTANPQLVQTAKVIPTISYQEAMELSHFGAKVIYPPTIQPLMTKNIPVWIKNTFEPEHPGTLIKAEANKNGGSIRGISSMSRVALLSLEGSGMVGIPGFSKRLFEALASQKINVILITQSSSEHSICVGVNEANIDSAKAVVDAAFSHEIETRKVEPLAVEKDLAIIALVGDSMKSHPGISGKMFGTLGRNGVNVRAIAQGSSERNISAVISTADVKKSVNVLHEEFFETTYKQLNLFVAGVGNVGSKLLAQLKMQQEYLQQHMHLQVRVVGIANSRKM